MTQTHISFIGGGNMARSIIGGLVAKGYPAKRIHASAPSDATRQALAADFGINVSAENSEACALADVLILSVKPQVILDVSAKLKDSLKPGALVISVAAGVTCDSLKSRLGHATPLVRCMPNTPALVRRGVSGLFATAEVTPAQQQQAEAILSAVGQVYWLDEEAQIDAVTAVSGSGPAYFFLFMEAMVDSAVKLGLPRETALRMALETAAGAAELAGASELSLAELRRRVTSPGGTTERAISVFDNRDLRGIVDEAMTACAERAKTLARELAAKH